VGAGKSVAEPFSFPLPGKVKPGRHVFAVRARDAHGAEPCDAFVAVDVE
jgi:hypothetical protein